MWLIVGLGNPGPQYQFTRHNIGFMALDYLVQGFSFSHHWQNQFKSDSLKVRINDQDILLLKPQTYMNKSGESVQQAVTFFKIPIEKVLVLHDEVDLPFKSVKLQKSRGHGGHNGVRNIHQLLGSNDYLRLRLGVGRPSHPEFSVADYVLQSFSKEEMSIMPDFLRETCEHIQLIVSKGYTVASNHINSKI